MAAADGDRANGTGPRGTRRRWIVLLTALLVSPVLAEAGLRYLLFGESDLARELGEALRRPELYATYKDDGDYWRLRRLFQEDEAERFRDHDFADGELGWRTQAILPGTYDHLAHPLVGDRTPVLFYGASFARPRYCQLLDATPLRRDYFLLWYGVGGYGVDQVYLLMRRSLDNYRDEDPVVVLGIGIHDDFERSLLDFRSWPKPRLRLVDGELTEPGFLMDTRTTLEREPPAIRSYVWSHLVENDRLPFGLAARLGGDAETLREKKDLTRALVLAIEEEVEARGFRCFYLLFSNLPALAQDGVGDFWQDDYVRRLLEERGIPYLDAGRALLEEAERTGTSVADLYHPHDHPEAGHPNARGEEVIAALLVRGLQGDFDG